MRKTSVYLSDEEIDGLRRAATASGKSQAELIRDGVRYVITQQGAARRVFHSLGKGRGGGAPYEPWDSDDLYARVMEAD